MANHMRQQIREGLVSTLTGLATTGTNVFDTPKHVLAESQLPALRIFAEPENIEMSAFGGGAASRTVQRSLSLRVEIVEQSNSATEDTIDQIIKEVEIAVANNQSLGCGCKWIQLRQVGEVQVSDDSGQPIVQTDLTFQAFYLTALNAPDVAL